MRVFSVIVLVSGAIGACVGSIFVIKEGYPLVRGLGISSFVGIVIGISATAAFMFAYRNVNKKAVISFLLVFIIIGIGTFLGPFFVGLRNYCYIGIMVVLAEIFGMAVTVIVFRKTRALNRSLIETQQRFKSGL